MKIPTVKFDGWYFLHKIERGMPMGEREVFEICNQVDSVIAKELMESIVIGTSYDKLEAHYGIFPISRNCFYIRKRKAKEIIKQQIVKQKTENR